MCLFHFLEICILHIITMLTTILSTASLSGIHIRTSLCTTLSSALSVHFSTCSLENSIDFCHSCINSS